MMEASSEIATGPDRNIRTWLLNPFHYLAGGQAMAIGVVFILAASFVESLVADLQSMYSPVPLWHLMVDGLIDWIVLAGLLLLGGKLISRSRVRALDVFGTQALAKAPTFLIAISMLLPAQQRILYKVAEGVQKSPADFAVMFIAGIAFLLMFTWMVWLMYRAYSVSCNVAGFKAIGVFIVAFVLGEVISKGCMRLFRILA